MQTAQYRPNACAALTNGQQMLIFRRIDGLGWQFPQGGIEADETPEQGMLRELKEETGIAEVEILRRLPQPICYAFPSAVRQRLLQIAPEKGKYVGQSQHWFLVRPLSPEKEIGFSEGSAEFDAYLWVDVQEALTRVPPFKRRAYRLALSLFGLISAPNKV